jgi:uncharacterized protein (DUF2147 family)
MRFLFNSLLLILVFLSASKPLLANDVIEGLWFNEEKTAKIEIFQGRDQRFYGKIAWLKEPMRDGRPKVDKENPDVRLRTQPILGLLILKEFRKVKENEYEKGTIYDPRNGKTYSCKMRYKAGKLEVRGYVGFSLLGRTTTWSRV